MPVKYILHNESLHQSIIWIPMVHGYLYPIYVLFAIQLSVSKTVENFEYIGLNFGRNFACGIHLGRAICGQKVWQLTL
jgi:hypothetical protein